MLFFAAIIGVTIVTGTSNSYLAEGGGYFDTWIVKFAPENNVQPIVADFSATPIFGTLPLSVSFTDQSTGSPTSWFWDFGDGSTSDLQNPIHTYTAEGNYTVNLTASNGNGSSSKTAEIEVKKPTINEGPYAYITN